MSETATTMRFKTNFAKSGARKPTDAPTLAAGREDPENGACVATVPRTATGRKVGGAARMLALAYLIEHKIEAGELRDYADAASRLGITRARISQIMDLMNLSACLQERLLTGAWQASERGLRAHVRDAVWEQQAARVSERTQRSSR